MAKTPWPRAKAPGPWPRGLGPGARAPGPWPRGLVPGARAPGPWPQDLGPRAKAKRPWPSGHGLLAMAFWPWPRAIGNRSVTPFTVVDFPGVPVKKRFGHNRASQSAVCDEHLRNLNSWPRRFRRSCYSRGLVPAKVGQNMCKTQIKKTAKNRPPKIRP